MFKHIFFQRLKTLSWQRKEQEKTYNSSTEEEVVFIHIEFAWLLKNLSTHLEGEEQLVPLK